MRDIASRTSRSRRSGRGVYTSVSSGYHIPTHAATRNTRNQPVRRGRSRHCPACRVARQLRSAPVAQGIERRFPKPCVAGSNPAGGATKKLVRGPYATGGPLRSPFAHPFAHPWHDGAVTGSVRQRAPGSWELRVHTGRDPLTGHKRYAHRTVKGTKREAQAALARLVTEVGDGAHAPVREGTVGEVLERWFDHGEADWSPTVVRSYRSIIDRVVLPRFGTTPLRRLHTADIDSFYAELRKRGGAGGARLSAASVRRIHSVLRRALALAVKWGLLSANPAANASPPREPHREASVPTAQDVGRLIEAAQAVNPDLSCFLRLAAVTGARRGELCGLTWHDVDFRNRRLLIERSVVVGRDGLLFEKETKTHASRRISLDAGTIESLRFHRRRCKQSAAAASAVLTDNAYVFSHDVANRTPWRPDYVTLAFSRIRDDLGLEVRLHDLRHFAATSMLVAGQDVRTVSGRLGHADAATTLGVYAHFLESADKDAADLMGEVLGPPGLGKAGTTSTSV